MKRFTTIIIAFAMIAIAVFAQAKDEIPSEVTLFKNVNIFGQE